MDFNESYEEFLRLLEKPKIEEFLNKDVCKVLADKYILATAFIYFRRAHFEKQDYNERNFYLAIYLIHDLYEEVEDLKRRIIKSYLKLEKRREISTIENFLSNRFALLQALGYKTEVSEYMCECVINKSSHWVWKRTRNLSHTGVLNNNFQCAKCFLVPNS